MLGSVTDFNPIAYLTGAMQVFDKDINNRRCSGFRCPIQYDATQPIQHCSERGSCTCFTPEYSPQEIADFLRKIATVIEKSNMT